MFTGFPIVLVTVVIVLGLSTLMVLGCTVIMLITITRCFRKVWMAHKYEELSWCSRLWPRAHPGTLALFTDTFLCQYFYEQQIRFEHAL